MFSTSFPILSSVSAELILSGSSPVGIANVLDIFQPDMICIGGGISREGEYLTDPLNEYVDGENYARHINVKTVIKTADLGNDAGIIGAAYLCNLYE